MIRFAPAFLRVFTRTVAVTLALSLTLAPMHVYATSTVIAPSGQTLSLGISKGLVLRLDRAASNIFVADPAVADIQIKSPTIIYVVGKTVGATTLFALDSKDQVIMNSRVEVHADTDGLQNAIHQLMPTSDIKVKSVSDSVVLAGPLKTATEGDDIQRIAARYVPDPKQLVNQMQLNAPNQINLQVKVAEVSRTVLKQLGVNWQNVYNNGTIAFGLMSGGASTVATTAVSSLLSTNTSSGSIVPNLPGNTAVGFNTGGTAIQSGATVNNLYGGLNSGSKSINTLITALENHGLVNILAEPNLTALSGQKASFLAGGEFPVPVPQSGSGGAAVVTIDYKQFGVGLTFIGTILGDNRISLHVEPEVSQIDTSTEIQVAGVTVPGLSERRAETTVELASGQSFAIAGLMQNNTTQNISKYPWLGDIPILGALFRSTAFQRDETELVIIVTPYIVQPVSSEQLAMPTDGMTTPTDFDMFMRDQMLGSDSKTQPASSSSQPMSQSSQPGTLPDGRKAGSPLGQVGFEID
ncbi:MAG: type II and III secretion system protein family protein [Stellaceae bacterium]|jgi:pilus assembly protein CpaC